MGGINADRKCFKNNAYRESTQNVSRVVLL